jgi:hypothetical protein
MYATGLGTDRNEHEALEYYRKAAEQKHPDAEFNIGYWYETGQAGLKRDYNTAAQWYARASDHGNARARDALDRLKSRGLVKD